MEAPERTFREIELDAIRLEEKPLRGSLDEDAFEELRSSIREKGVLVPILVVEEGDGYRLIAGQRRYLACMSLEMATIPAICLKAGVEYRSWATLAENLLREQVNALDEAVWLLELMNREGLDQAGVSHILRRSESWVSQRLSILKWPQDVRHALHTRKVSFAVGRELAAIGDARIRGRCIQLAITCGCSVRQASTWRRNWVKDAAALDRVPDQEDGAIVEGGEDDSCQCALCLRLWPARLIEHLPACEQCRAKVASLPP